jgi:hypothetical protein
MEGETRSEQQSRSPAGGESKKPDLRQNQGNLGWREREIKKPNISN